MYDFLVYRSIDILNTISRYDIVGQNFHEQATTVRPVKEFVQMPIEVKRWMLIQTRSNFINRYLQSEIAAQRTDAILISIWTV